MPERSIVEKNKKEFPPGSKIAMDNGCTCCPKENNRGKGFNKLNYIWLIDSECPLHWCESKIPKRKRKNSED